MMHEGILTELLNSKTFHIYHQTSNTLIGWIEEDGIVYNYHKGFVTGERYREHGLKLLEAVKEYSARKLFNNVVDIHIIPIEDQQWTNEVLIPQMITAGIKVSAYMVPPRAFDGLSIDELEHSVLEAVKGDFISLPFEDEIKAYEWLQAQKV